MSSPADPYVSGHGSVGPLIAVLAVISILGVIAGMVGRLCSGRPVFGYGHYDVVSWLETKCSSCLDGSPDPVPLRPAPPPEPVPAPQLKEEGRPENLQSAGESR